MCFAIHIRSGEKAGEYGKEHNMGTRDLSAWPINIIMTAGHELGNEARMAFEKLLYCPASHALEETDSVAYLYLVVIRMRCAESSSCSPLDRGSKRRYI